MKKLVKHLNLKPGALGELRKEAVGFTSTYMAYWCLKYSKAKPGDSRRSIWRLRMKRRDGTTVILPEIPFQLLETLSFLGII